ncbi:restriction endonuclease subunit S [Muribaculaceae bacterium Isolate-037 (Harlan)]|nr:restriction endonuclease subunit S [Muribaculaceae bacterium Isolate-037 (Harlan)]
MRFPGFSDEWETYSINEISNIVKGSGISKEQLSKEGEECILYGELYTKYKSEIIDEVFSKTDINSTKLTRSQHNDVIIPCSGESAEDIATARCVTRDGILLGGDLNIIRFNGQNGAFMSYQLNGKRKYDIARVTQGVSVVHLYPDHLKSVKVSTPSLKEQNRIVKLLSLIDKRISTQNKIIEKLQSLIKGLIQKLTKEGISNSSWHKVILSNILIERCEQNKESYPVHSVSVTAGVINQVEYLGRSFAANDTSRYHVVRYGDIIYTKSPTGNQPYGIVKQSHCQEPVAVSPLYGVYKPLSFEIGNYLHYYFLNPLNTNNYLSPLIQKGAKNTINISNQRFLGNKIPIPVDIKEIRTISNTLSAINQKIQTEKSIHTSLVMQKKFLLQKLFI